MAEQKLKTSDVFSPEFIEEMKQRLMNDKEQLENKLGLFAKKVVDGEESPDGTYPEYGDDEDDNVAEIEQFLVNQNTKVQFEKELRDIEKALARMEDETYGICKYTGEAIAEARLRARPTSSSSTEAKSAFKP